MNVELLMMKGILSELPPEKREKIEACADKLRDLIREHGEAGQMAFVLVAAEYAEKLEGK